MKVILLKQVPKLGNAGDIIEVAHGYARNFLMPQGYVREATSEALNSCFAAKDKKSRDNDIKQERSQKIYNVLDGKIVHIRAKANNEGHLFGGIGAKEIALAIFDQKKIQINENQIEIPYHLKELGKHDVKLNLSGQSSTKIIVEIQSE
jgi:large subunit ribosomal protein L9